MNESRSTQGKLLRANLLRLAIGSWQAQVLFTATRVGIFTRLAATPDATAADIVSATGSNLLATELLLNACSAMRLLTKDGDHYRNAEIAQHYLVPDSDEYLGDWVALLGDWARPWLHLENAVAAGGPIENPFDHLGGDTAYTEHFILAMHQYALTFGESFVKQIDLTGVQSLLDVGGGAGTYAILLARKYPNLRGIIFDLPEVTAITARMIAKFGLSDQLQVVAGNYHHDRLPGPVDAILLSNVLQQENPETCRSILARAREALAPGGTLIVQGMFLEESRIEPLWVALHALTMLLVAGGRAYTFGEIEGMLREIGFSDIELIRQPLLNAEAYFIAKYL